MSEPHTIRVVAFCEGEKWVAQCLEYDIGAQANDLDTLQKLFAMALEAEVAESIAQHGEAFAGIPPAPHHYEERWAKQSSVFKAADFPSGGIEVEFALAA